MTDLSDEWDGTLPRDGWCWLIRRDDEQRRMAFYSHMNGWRVADSIGRTVYMSSGKVARLFQRGGRVVDPAGLEVILIGEDGFYVHTSVKAEIERLRSATEDAPMSEREQKVEPLRKAADDLEATGYLASPIAKGLHEAIDRLARHLVPDEEGSPEPTADEMEEWDHERRQKLARDLEY